MANPEHLAVLKEGVEVWNQWRKDNPEIRPDLRRGNFSDANLRRIDLHGAGLRGAELIEANLHMANLIGADLSWADLSGVLLRNSRLITTNLGDAKINGANLSYSNLNSASLTGASLHEASLIGADLTNAVLTKTDLLYANFNGTVLRSTIVREAVVGRTTFADIDLRQFRDLESVIHAGPSTVGLDTIFKSAGDIPEGFLHGAGVPEQFIKYARSLVENPIEYYSVFISHSSRDAAFAGKLHADLQRKEIRAWYFPEDAKWGETVWGEIDRGVKHHDKLVLVCSENSLQSGPVLRELERALNREDKEGKSVLFPIRIDDYIFEAWEHERKADVLRKIVGDFGDWETDAAKYESAFTRLLSGLKAEL